ncbi:glycosyltransferase family 4 protein [Pseudoalteromonas sp. T1lg76]|uniref:glycosyltransferase family 4 protein n=1 Tax=Pseudoalteromonas sp. T1lg76 TaxID=2077103 RepID=UPI000CF66C54|nr:glycosyltransferase family 4 protein [Pseudoalteromonas sp. T1lg76]
MKKVLIVGLPFFPHKYQYLVDSYKKSGIEPKVLLNSSQEDFNGEVNGTFYFSGRGRWGRFLSYFRALKDFKPKNIDCYDYSIFTIFYIITARALGINVRYWLIGWELVGDNQNTNATSKVTRFLTYAKMRLSRLSLNFANHIYAKEHHHLESIRAINPHLLTKVISIYNCVPVGEFVGGFNRAGDFLYANAVIEKRNVIELIDSFNELKNKGASFSASIYGFNSISNDVYAPRGVHYSDKALNHFKNLDLDESVRTYGFVNNIKDVMKEFKFFVLPADIVLANYALLEAMSFGLVPIVYPGDGYEVLIDDGISGIVAKDYNLTKALECALKMPEDKYLEMSEAAYNKIKKDFSLALWERKISQNIVG